jgi:thiol-disulfide isomerase/thioredoxin
METKNILLGIAIVLIAGSIWYLQSSKVRPESRAKGDVLTENIDATTEENSATNNSASSTTSVDIPTQKIPEPKKSMTASIQSDTASRKAQKAKEYKPSREIIPGGEFINSDAFKLKDYIGKKIILVDFWTYSCINCQRTTPYLNAWYQKYKDQGLVIVGVHTPEFDFEKVYDNVAKAVKEAGIKYPVVQDNAYATWRTYSNQFWPRKYLIDIDGYIIYDHIGEGAYEETEKKIQEALAERAKVIGATDSVSSGTVRPTGIVAVGKGSLSPETYFGSDRNNLLGNGDFGVQGTQTLTAPSTFNINKLYLNGAWNFTSEYARTEGPATITYKYRAMNVYFVASSKNGSKITVLIDGVPAGAHAGADISAEGIGTIKDNRLYKLIQSPSSGEHTLEIRIDGAGLDAYTFTFG